MKAALINRYFDFRAGIKWANVPGAAPGIQDALAGKMHRIDTILFERYGYDVSLTRTTI